MSKGKMKVVVWCHACEKKFITTIKENDLITHIECPYCKGNNSEVNFYEKISDAQIEIAAQTD